MVVFWGEMLLVPATGFQVASVFIWSHAGVLQRLRWLEGGVVASVVVFPSHGVNTDFHWREIEISCVLLRHQHPEDTASTNEISQIPGHNFKRGSPFREDKLQKAKEGLFEFSFERGPKAP